jgi:aminoglycoside phosphotransferase (APT) family kinase protein
MVSGGKSNLTFAVDGPAGGLIVRRPPTGALLPSAHDMGREARIQRALAGSAVPVAPVLLDDEGDLIGVPCYVMRRVDGLVIRGDLPEDYAGEASERLAMSEAFIDTLAALHALRPETVGLADYGRSEGFLQRQVGRWAKQWEASRTSPVPVLEELGRRLAAQIPVSQAGSIVHGDYRLDNVIYAASDPGRIAAVLDWELSTLGDPLTDLGMLLLFWRQPGEPAISLIPGVTHLDGFPSRTELINRYAERSTLDLNDLGFYEAFAHYKFAVIVQGVAARGRAGAMGGQHFGDLDQEILDLAEVGLTKI